GLVGDADDLVRRLAVELEVQFRFRPAVVPRLERPELAASEAALRKRRARDPDADSRGLAANAALSCDRFSAGDDSTRDQTTPAFVLAREHEDRVAFDDVFAAIHRLRRSERKRLRPGIPDFGFDREPSPRPFLQARNSTTPLDK